MIFENIICERFEDKSLINITINRPPLNIINTRTIKEIAEAISEVKEGDTFKVITVRGKGDKAFSVGIDIKEHLPEKIHETMGALWDLHMVIKNLDQVTIAITRGYVLGGGWEVANMCDMIIASENSLFGHPEIKLAAFPPLAIPSYPRIIGHRKTLEILLTGDFIRARKAESMGLINLVVRDRDLEEASERLIRKITDISLVAIKYTKKALSIGANGESEEAAHTAWKIYLEELAHTKDNVEGMKAFLEKRRPEWKNE
ncbi:MAG: enoyl-CoA hydratase/isomerase family protein [bacterium]|nr:enoyl-CoA hydratase/isomerase family protein [bacterium]